MDSFGEFRWLTLASNRGKRVWSLNKFLAHGAKFQFKTKYDCPMIQGVSKKRYVSDFLSYFSSRGRILHFHLCFGIRISSPFHQNTLNIPIQNIKCPQKSFSSQSLFVKLELCRLCTSMPNPICVTGNAIHESHCSHCWGELIKTVLTGQWVSDLNPFRRCVLSILGRAQSVIGANGGFIED